MFDRNARATTGLPSSLLLFLCLSALVIDNSAATDVPIAYGQPFVIYSDTYNSFCKPYSGADNGVACDLNVTNPADAEIFVIRGGTGSVSVSSSAVNYLGLYYNEYDTPVYCLSTSGELEAGYIFCQYINDQPPSTAQFVFVNSLPWSDGYLHGNYSLISFKSVSTGGWCSAQPITYEGAAVCCNRATISAWEQYHFFSV